MKIDLEMFEGAETRRFNGGETIFAQGDVGGQMFVILEGIVELRVGVAIVEALGKAEPFGEMALIDQAPRMASAIARTDCTLVPIPRERFLTMVQEHPTFALDIMSVMTDRLRRMDARTLGIPVAPRPKPVER